jgi:carbon monoxide dehydrogenase subunit G
VRLENSFDVPVAPAEAWRILTDVERVAPCVPGARLTEVLDDDAYKGTMQVKLGPVSLAFDGKAQFVERDDDAHTAKLRANGRETRNRGTADADVSFVLEPQGDGTLVRIETELQLSGPVAQYGRSQGVILSVSEEMIDRFAAALKKDILAADSSAASEAPATSAATDTPPPPASGVSIGFGAVMRMIRRFFAGLFGKA